MENMFEEYEKKTSLHGNKRNDPALIKEQIPVATIQQPTTTSQQMPLKTVTVKYFPTKKKKSKPIITGKDIKAAKRGFKTLTRGYSGTAKQAYNARMKKIKSRQEEMTYKQKLDDLKYKEKLRAKGRRAVKIHKVKKASGKLRVVGRLGKSIGRKLQRNKSIYR